MADEMEKKVDAEMKDAEETPKENGDKEEKEPKEEKEEEEKKDDEEEEEKEPEKPAEKEEDAAEDGRPKVTASDVKMSPTDCTMNSMQTANGKVLMTLTEGGMQYLLASSRATTGIKAGRYAFEVKIVETLNPSEGSSSGEGQKPMPRNLVRIGLSLAKSSIFLADTQDSICFDSEGYFVHGRKRARSSQKFMRGHAVTMVVNMMEGSENANTVSLFRNGTRISQPQKIPEALVGKTLYPTVTYRNVTVQVNLGPVLSSALPFTCRTLSDAAEADVEVAKVPSPGQCEVLFPVGMPDQGYFDWVDDFVSKNPTFTEISDRKIAEWGSKSGMWKSKPQPGASTDKPESKFGITMMDDGSVRKVLQAVAPTLNRNFIIPEMKANLIPEERKKLLEKYAVLGFKAKAAVLMGEPTAEYKAKVQELMLTDKKNKAEAIKKKKAQEEERKRLLEEKKKKAEQAKKARVAANLKKQGKAADEDEEPEAKEEDAEEKAEEKEEPSVEIELTDEEKALWYRKKAMPDLDAKTLTKCYASFSLPTTEEGFAGVDYVWQPQNDCEKALRDWILAQKMTQKVQDLVPGEWFKTEYAKWQKQVQEWRKRQSEWKDPKKRKEYLAKKAEEAKKKKAEAAKEAGEDAEEAPAEEESKPMEINAEDVDVFEVEDVSDLGNGEPLFAHFVYEDWVVLGLHYELHMLLHAFKKDLNDPDRPSFPEEHLAFYYQKYIKKAFKLDTFNLKSMAEFLEIVKEAVVVPEGSKFLKAVLDEDTSFKKFMQIAEDHRRDRQRRLDAGDETAKLKFNKPSPPPPKGAPPSGGNAGSRNSSYSGPASGGRSGGYRGGSSPGSYSGGGGGGRGGSGYGSGGGGSSGPWKRSAPPAPAHPPSKYQRTSSYSAAPRGGSGGYYRR